MSQSVSHPSWNVKERQLIAGQKVRELPHKIIPSHFNNPQKPWCSNMFSHIWNHLGGVLILEGMDCTLIVCVPSILRVVRKPSHTQTSNVNGWIYCDASSVDSYTKQKQVPSQEVLRKVAMFSWNHSFWGTIYVIWPTKISKWFGLKIRYPYIQWLIIIFPNISIAILRDTPLSDQPKEWKKATFLAETGAQRRHRGTATSRQPLATAAENRENRRLRNDMKNAWVIKCPHWTSPNH